MKNFKIYLHVKTLSPKILDLAILPSDTESLKRMRKQCCLERISLFFHGCLKCRTNLPYGTIRIDVAINPWV